jgi:hypothetical protein
MTTRRVRLAVLFGLAALAVPEFATGQGGGAIDTVYFRDRKKDYQVTTARGEVKESAAGVQVVSGGKVTHTLSPADVVRVEYGKLAGMSDTARLQAVGFEGKEVRDVKDAVAARNFYTDALKAAGADAKSRKFLEFREAIWAARVADAKAGADFEAEAKGAIDKLGTVARAYPKSWEVWPAARAAARLQAETGKPNDAATTLAALGKNPDLPADLRYEARLAELEVLLRSNRLAADSLAAELAKDKSFPATGPLRELLTVYQALLKAPPPKGGTKPAEVKAVEDVIAKATDPGVRAAAHNALGEFYLAHNRPRDAMWEFLWVDTVYNQDKEEVVKAVLRLIEVCPKAGQPDVAEKYKERLPQKKAALYTRDG